MAQARGMRQTCIGDTHSVLRKAICRERQTKLTYFESNVMFTLCLCFQRASLMGYHSTVGLWNKHLCVSLQGFHGKDGTAARTAHQCSEPWPHPASSLLPYVRRETSQVTVGARLWGSQASDCQRPRTQDVNPGLLDSFNPFTLEFFCRKRTWHLYG